MKKLIRSMITAMIIAVLASSAFAMTKEEEDAAWKLEPDYGRTIRLGYNGGLCTGTVGIAVAKGFYEAEGLKTEWSRYQGNTVVQADAIGTDRIDVAVGHIATLLVPAANGVRMKFTTPLHNGCKTLFVLKDSPVKTTKDLVGKTICVPDGVGTADHNITMRMFLRDGLDPLRDFRYVPSDMGASIIAMKNGEIDAVLLTDQFAQRFVDDGTIRSIRSLTTDDDFKIETCCIHAVNLGLWERSPITAKKITRAHKKACDWIMENREEAVKILLENKWASGDYDFVLKIYKTMDYDLTDKTTEETLIKVIDDYKHLGILAKDRDTQAILSQVWDPILTRLD